jgi:beta-hydroxylase
LFADVERPVHTPVIRWLNKVFANLVMTAAATQNVEGEPVGGLNKFFYHAYQVRLKGKALKERSRMAYYVGKWALIGLLVWALFF